MVMMRQKPQIGESLRQVRSERRLSLATVAEKAGVSIATLSRVETNKQNVDVDLLLVLARVLEVPVSVLLGQPDEADDVHVLSRRLAKLPSADRTRIFLDAARRRDPAQLSALVDDLLSMVDVLREELIAVQRAVRRKKR
jgi:transcriptional regulator with XRE-family HTH domain